MTTNAKTKTNVQPKAQAETAAVRSRAKARTRVAGAWPRAKALAVALVAAVLVAATLGGCAAGAGGRLSGAADGGAAEIDAPGSFAAVAAAFDPAALDLGYSARDRDASYDEASATRIQLAGDTAQAGGTAVRVEGAQVTVTGGGTYLIVGALEGQLAVDAGDEDKVQLVLAGVDIRNETGPALFIENADKCFVTLAEGTENALSDGAGYALADGEDEPNAALFSKDDLTINGAGSLSVAGAYRHAVHSKDDLVVTGGALSISAAEDGLRGKDCVKMGGGAVSITAAGDGVRSSNDGDATRGFVSVDGGTLAVDANGKGVSAETYVRIAGGSVTIDAEDDALHSNLAGTIADGRVMLRSGDDAFHAETELVLDGGEVDVTACYEGYEAERVIVSGGTHAVVASDDALNAAVADLGEEDAGGSAAAFAGAGEKMPQSSDDCLIQVNGGELRLTAGSDAIDSNGRVEFNGGTVLASGPDQGMDGVLDYDKTAKVTGGTLVLLGSVGSTRGLSDSTQPLAVAGVSGEAGQTVALATNEGATLASWTAPAAFRTVLVSAPALGEGDACQVIVDGAVSEVTVSVAVEEKAGFLGGGASDGAGPGGTPPDGTPPDGVASDAPDGAGSTGAQPDGAGPGGTPPDGTPPTGAPPDGAGQGDGARPERPMAPQDDGQGQAPPGPRGGQAAQI